MATIIRGMSNASRFPRSTQIRFNPRAKLALERLVSEMKASERIKFHGETMTQEVLLNASWIWMGSLEISELEKAIAPFVRQLERLTAHETGSETKPGEGDPPHASGSKPAIPADGPKGRKKKGAG